MTRRPKGSIDEPRPGQWRVRIYDEGERHSFQADSEAEAYEIRRTYWSTRMERRRG